MSRPRHPDTELLRLATRRLGLQIGLCAAVIVVMLSAFAVLVVIQGQHRAADTLLDQTIARADDVTDPPAGVWLVIAGPRGRAATPGAPAGLPDQEALTRTAVTGVPTVGEYDTGGVEYQVHTVRRDDLTVQAALDLTANHAERYRLALALLLSGGLGLILAAFAGAWLGRRAVRPMATALAMQRRFVADAGHELRTPLTLLSTRAQLLSRQLRRAESNDEVPQAAGAVAGIVADARHLTAILDDLLLVADGAVATEVFDLRALVTDVVETYQLAAGERGATLTGPGPDDPTPVVGAPTAVRRAMNALLDNALRHATAAVAVTVTADGRTATVEVADDGPGIASDVLPHMFDRFATTRAVAPGPAHRRYGLGLALVSDIAARHGGDVTADTSPGGARLRLSLPLA